MNVITVLLVWVYLHVIRGRALYDQIDIQPIITNRNIAFLAARPSSQRGAVVVKGISLLSIWKPYSPYVFSSPYDEVNGPILKVEPFNKTDWLVLRGDCLIVIPGVVNSRIHDYLGDCGGLRPAFGFSNISELLRGVPQNEKGTVFHDFATDPNSSRVYFMLSGKNELYRFHDGVLTVVARSLPLIRQVEYAFDQKLPYLLTMNSDIYRVGSSGLEIVFRESGSFEIFDIEYYEDGVWLLQTKFPFAEETQVWFAFLDLNERQPKIVPFNRTSGDIPLGRIWRRQELDMVMVHKLGKVIIPQKHTVPGLFGYYVPLKKYPDLVTDIEMFENQFLKFKYKGDARKIKKITLNCIPVCKPTITAVAEIPYWYKIYDREVAGIAEKISGQPLHRTIKLNVIKFSVPDRRTSNVFMTIELIDGVVFTARAISITPQATILLVPSSGLKPLLTFEILGPFTLQLKMHLQQLKSTPPTKLKISRIADQPVNIESKEVNNSRIIRWDLTTNENDINYYKFSINEEPPEIRMEFLDANGASQLVQITRPTINEETTTTTTMTTSITTPETTTNVEDEEKLISGQTKVIVTLSGFLFILVMGVIGITAYVYIEKQSEKKCRDKLIKRASSNYLKRIFRLRIATPKTRSKNVIKPVEVKTSIGFKTVVKPDKLPGKNQLVRDTEYQALKKKNLNVAKDEVKYETLDQSQDALKPNLVKTADLNHLSVSMDEKPAKKKIKSYPANIMSLTTSENVKQHPFAEINHPQFQTVKENYPVQPLPLKVNIQRASTSSWHQVSSKKNSAGQQDGRINQLHSDRFAENQPEKSKSQLQPIDVTKTQLEQSKSQLQPLNIAEKPPEESMAPSNFGTESTYMSSEITIEGK